MSVYQGNDGIEKWLRLHSIQILITALRIAVEKREGTLEVQVWVRLFRILGYLQNGCLF